ncbi:MAG: putative glycolipid-binding domain-containing protein [Pseudonocardiaceae bacterium]
MNAAAAGGRPVGDTGARRTSVTRMLAWVGQNALRLEAARVVLGERSLRATGSVVDAPQQGAEPYSASYALATDEAGVVRRLTVRTVRAEGEQHVTLNRSEEGLWLIDHGAGAVRTDFDGALDVDLAASPLFNAIPLRRLDLHRASAEHVLPMVFVDLPSLEVRLVRQTYRSVSVDDPAVVSYAGDSSEVELTVDADGLVLDYPGLARRA